MRKVRNDVPQVGTPVFGSQRADRFRADEDRYILNAIHRIEVWKKRYGKPVAAGDVAIPANDHPQFSRIAAPQFGGRGGADLRQVDGRVSGRDGAPERTIGVFYRSEERRVGKECRSR